MTHDEWVSKTNKLKRSLSSLRGHARSGRYTLAEKLEKLAAIKEKSEELRQHQLNYHTLVTE